MMSEDVDKTADILSNLFEFEGTNKVKDSPENEAILLVQKSEDGIYNGKEEDLKTSFFSWLKSWLLSLFWVKILVESVLSFFS